MDQDKVAVHLREIEAVAQEILADREEIVALDRKRQKNREALRTLQLQNHNEDHKDKSWVMLGSLFMKLPSSKANTLLEKDQNELDTTIASLRDNLRNKVNKLRDLEKQPELKGFGLKPMTRDEMSAVNHILGQT